MIFGVRQGEATPYRRQELQAIHRLNQIICRSQRERKLTLAQHRADDYWDPPRCGMTSQDLESFPAVLVWHHRVERDRAWLFAERERQGFLTTRSLQNAIISTGQISAS